MYRVSVNFASGRKNYDFYSLVTAIESYHYVRNKMFCSGDEILGVMISSVNENGHEVTLEVCGIMF